MSYSRERLKEHMAIRTLTLDDIDEFERIENACFPPSERCTREKFVYRISACPELSAGVFLRTFATKSQEEAQAAENNEDDDISVQPYDSRNRRDLNLEGKSLIVSEKLVGYVLSTKMKTPFVTDGAMEIPVGEEQTKDGGNSQVGHFEEGRTIGIHSFCVDPDYQGQMIGTVLLRDYIQRFSHMHIAEFISLIAHEKLVPYYKRLDFHDHGESECKFGGTSWRDMRLVLVDEDDE